MTLSPLDKCVLVILSCLVGNGLFCITSSGLHCCRNGEKNVICFVVLVELWLKMKSEQSELHGMMEPKGPSLAATKAHHRTEL